MWAKVWQRPVERAIELGLAGGVHQVIVAPDDVADRHVVVVHDHREHVGGRAVRAQQHHVVELLVGKAHGALHPILDHRLAMARGPEPDHRGYARRRSGRAEIAATPVVTGGPALGARALTHQGELLRRAVAVVRGTPGQ